MVTSLVAILLVIKQCLALEAKYTFFKQTKVDSTLWEDKFTIKQHGGVE